jgi:ubiquinone/menaquinone biosynthesis C-methylase UbiE
MLSILKKALIEFKFKRVLSARRYKLICKLIGQDLSNHGGKYTKILEVGCANGKDFVSFCKGNNAVRLTGIDIADYGLRQGNFKMVVADAEEIKYPDNYFDLTVSIGVLEHIQPIEKLAKVISEIDRVSKSFVVIVPAISTIIEPHTASIFWQLRSIGNKRRYSCLNYYSDDAWLQFSGFREAKVLRFFHLPPIITNLVLYKVK